MVGRPVRHLMLGGVQRLDDQPVHMRTSDRIHRAPALAAHRDQTGKPEFAQMLRHRGAGRTNRRRQGGDVAFPIEQAYQ